jgi:hypothetical protein
MGDAKSNGGKTNVKLIWAKRAGPFVCIFAVVYGLLMGLWPVWRNAYSKFYVAGATLLFESCGSRAIVYFSQPDDARPDEVKITFYDRQRVDEHARPIPLMRAAHDVRYGVYIYMAFMMALVLATPVPWRRKGRALFWGLILIHAFTAFRLALLIAQLLSSKQVALLGLPWFWKKALLLNVQVFTINILPSFVVAILIWAFLSFRREDWSRLLAPPGAATGAGRDAGRFRR